MKWILFLLVWSFIASAAIAGLSAAPWVPTRKRERNQLKKIPLPAQGIVMDLGCGDGSLLFGLKETAPTLRYIGYDISLIPLCIGWIRILMHQKKYHGVSLRFGNLFSIDPSRADVVTLFLMPNSYKKIIKKIGPRLKDDCLVLVEAWPLPNITPEASFAEQGALPIFLYHGRQLKSL
ncbi:MAG: class I SAM-dependent methyltransferase [Patescibacteria group bacterium]|jgi:hypothetical protein